MYSFCFLITLLKLPIIHYDVTDISWPSLTLTMKQFKLKNNHHVSTVLRAFEAEKTNDVNIRFFCEDGQFLTKATPFKHCSSYLYKVLNNLGPCRLPIICEYPIYLPNTYRNTIVHISAQSRFLRYQERFIPAISQYRFS